LIALQVAERLARKGIVPYKAFQGLEKTLPKVPTPEGMGGRYQRVLTLCGFGETGVAQAQTATQRF